MQSTLYVIKALQMSIKCKRLSTFCSVLRTLNCKDETKRNIIVIKAKGLETESSIVDSHDEK